MLTDCWARGFRLLRASGGRLDVVPGPTLRPGFLAYAGQGHSGGGTGWTAALSRLMAGHADCTLWRLAVFDGDQSALLQGLEPDREDGVSRRRVQTAGALEKGGNVEEGGRIGDFCRGALWRPANGPGRDWPRRDEQDTRLVRSRPGSATRGLGGQHRAPWSASQLPSSAAESQFPSSAAESQFPGLQFPVRAEESNVALSCGNRLCTVFPTVRQKGRTRHETTERHCLHGAGRHHSGGCVC